MRAALVSCANDRSNACKSRRRTRWRALAPTIDQIAMKNTAASAEHPVREVIAKIDAAWRLKQFDGLDECFHEEAVIVGPGYAEFARGRKKCAESYREFATNAAVLSVLGVGPHAAQVGNHRRVHLCLEDGVSAPARPKARSRDGSTRVRVSRGSLATGLALHLL